MNVSVTVEFQNIPSRHKSRVDEIMADGTVTDAEMIELINMKMNTWDWKEPVNWRPKSQRYEWPVVVGRIRRDRPMLRRLVWLAIVGTAALAAILL